MKASTRKLGIVLTFLFIGLAGYAGYELYQLPVSISENISKERDARIREIRMLILDNRDRRGKNLNDRDLLKAIREELVREVKGKESLKREIAQDLAMPTYRAFALALLAGIGLMFLLLASSYQTSAETIVYIERQEEETDQEEEDSNEHGQLADFTHKLKKQSSELDTSKQGLEEMLSEIATRLNVGAAAVYQVKKKEEPRKIELLAGYAFIVSDSEAVSYEFGEGLAGQVAKTGSGKLFSSVPSGYLEVFSGLGESTPNYLAVLPMIKNNEVVGVMEIALMEKISDQDYQHLQEINNLIGKQSDWGIA